MLQVANSLAVFLSGLSPPHLFYTLLLSSLMCLSAAFSPSWLLQQVALLLCTEKHIMSSVKTYSFEVVDALTINCVSFSCCC